MYYCIIGHMIHAKMSHDIRFYLSSINVIMMVSLPESDAYMVCQCCFNNLSAKNTTVCNNGHRVCNQCTKKMKRMDCLFCSPYHRSISIIDPPLNPTTPMARRTLHTTTPMGRSTLHPTTPMARRTLKLRNFMGSLGKPLYSIIYLVVGFFAAVYIGKVYVAIWYGCNPQFDSSWFSWGSLHNCIGEAFIGLVVSMVLAGCCVSK
jgi:hypothetical protein